MAIQLQLQMSGPPALLGGRPAFTDGLPLIRPSVPDADPLVEDFRAIISSGTLTNGRFVRELEERAASYLDVRHCVAVSSCTSGLMLALRAANLSGDVLVPSFTFSATAHAVSWNGLRPVFCDIDPSTLTLSPPAARRAAGLRVSAIVATHAYGAPCDVEGLIDVAADSGLRLFFDAAPAFGAEYKGMRVGGFGDAEIFSLTPTKVLVACEGGIIATNDDVLAENCRIGRDYGNPGNYDCRFVGLSARMSEFHAATALHSLDGLDGRIDRRNELASLYALALADIPGLTFPEIRRGDRSTYKDFVVVVDPLEFGLDASGLAEALAAERIETRRYYSPPVHSMLAYRFLAAGTGPLPATEEAASRVITLPLWSEMEEDDVVLVAEAIQRIRKFLAHTSITNGGPAVERSVTIRLPEEPA